MSAALLREAADWLDALADPATPGPWEAHIRSVQPEATHPHVGWVSTPKNRVTVVDSAWDGDAAYIAAMSPTVGKALAAWLRAAADGRHLGGLSGCRERDPSRKPNARGACPACEALAVARAVLGRDA